MKRVFFTFGAFTNQKGGGISRQMYNLLSINSKYNNNISTSFKFHRNEYLKKNYNYFRNNTLDFKGPIIFLILINIIYDFFYKIFFYNSIFHETLFFNFFKFSKKTKTIVTIHDLIDEKFNNKKKNLFINFKTKIKILLRIISIKNSDKIICVSNNTKKDLLKIYNKHVQEDKVLVIYPGFFNNKKFNLKIKKIKKKNYKKKFILFVGKRSGYKNFNNFINAFAKLRNNKKYCVYCFGDNKFAKTELQYFESLNLQNQIFHKTGSDFALANLYKCAEFLILPSLYEGFGVPSLEAMYLSCPVLASSNRSLDEVVGDAALKFNPYKVSDISNAMNYYFENKKKIKPVLIKKGLQRVKNFSWEKMTKEVNEIYKNLN